MERDGLLRCLKQSATGPYSEPVQIIAYHFTTYFNIIMPRTLSSVRPRARPTRWSLPAGFPIKILYALLIAPMRATCLIMTPLTFGEEIMKVL